MRTVRIIINCEDYEKVQWALGCAHHWAGLRQLGHFIKVKLYKLEGNKLLVKGCIGKSLIRIDGVGVSTRVSYTKW